MQPTDRSHAIAFLLSLGAIPLGCPTAEDTGTSTFTTAPTSVGSSTVGSGTDSVDTDEGGGTDGNTTASTTMTSGSTMSSSATMTTDPTITTDPITTDPSMATDPDTGYGTYGSYGSGGSGGYDCGPVPPGCSQYAAKVIECYPRYAAEQDAIAQSCTCEIDFYTQAYGAGCGGAIEDFYACLAVTSCEELAGGMACGAESMAAMAACAGG